MAEYSKERLYFLKLPKDFFQGHQMRVLEGLPNGKEYELMYLKLMCESIAFNGYLRFSQDVPYTPEMIAGITNTPIDTVIIGLKILQGLGLVGTTDEGSIYLPEVPKMTETTTIGAAKKLEQRTKGGQKGDICPPRDIDIKSLRDIEDVTTSTTLHSVDSVTLSKTSHKPVIKQSLLCEIMVEKGFLRESELDDPQWDDLMDDYVAFKGTFVDTKRHLLYVLDQWKWAGKPDKDNKYMWLKAAMDEQFEHGDKMRYGF